MVAVGLKALMAKNTLVTKSGNPNCFLILQNLGNLYFETLYLRKETLYLRKKNVLQPEPEPCHLFLPIETLVWKDSHSSH